VCSASREIAAVPEMIFELIADPAQQPRWDGSDNLAVAAVGQRIQKRYERAHATTSAKLQISLDRLAALVETS
jgi:uncharacterized protein YndB with AHSA1/START domain